MENEIKKFIETNKKSLGISEEEERILFEILLCLKKYDNDTFKQINKLSPEKKRYVLLVENLKNIKCIKDKKSKTFRIITSDKKILELNEEKLVYIIKQYIKVSDSEYFYINTLPNLLLLSGIKSQLYNYLIYKYCKKFCYWEKGSLISFFEQEPKDQIIDYINFFTSYYSEWNCIYEKSRIKEEFSKEYSYIEYKNIICISIKRLKELTELFNSKRCHIDLLTVIIDNYSSKIDYLTYEDLIKIIDIVNSKTLINLSPKNCIVNRTAIKVLIDVLIYKDNINDNNIEYKIDDIIIKKLKSISSLAFEAIVSPLLKNNYSPKADNEIYIKRLYENIYSNKFTIFINKVNEYISKKGIKRAQYYFSNCWHLDIDDHILLLEDYNDKRLDILIGNQYNSEFYCLGGEKKYGVKQIIGNDVLKETIKFLSKNDCRDLFEEKERAINQFLEKDEYKYQFEYKVELYKWYLNLLMPKNKDYKKPEKQIRHIRVCRQIFELIDLYYVMKELENISNSELIFEALTNCQQVSTMKAYCDFIMINKEYKPEIQEGIINRILQIEYEDDLPEIINFIKEETFKNSTLQSQKELINKNFLIDRTKFSNEEINLNITNYSELLEYLQSNYEAEFVSSDNNVKIMIKVK